MSKEYILPSLPVELPLGSVPEVADQAALKQTWQTRLNAPLTGDEFVSDAVWRDLFSFTGTARTFYGPRSITTAWNETSHAIQCHDFSITSDASPSGPGGNSWLDLSFSFSTHGPPATTGSGFLSLVHSEGNGWQIWMIRTMLEQIQGQPDVDVASRSTGPRPPRAGPHFDCVIVGGGQAGLAIGGRLQALDVSYVVLEKHARAGDSWRTRYDSAKLHTIREYSHMPFERTWGIDECTNEWLGKDQLADGYERWVRKYEINVWLSTTLVRGSWEEEGQLWSLTVNRDGKGDEITCRYFVFAAGVGCEVPVVPSWPGQDDFKGLVLHSSRYQNANDWGGKHGVVVGSANTAHDVAEDMLEAGLKSVTMVQRNPTLVVNTEHFSTLARRFYNEKVPTKFADQMNFMGPAAVGRLLVTGGLNMLGKQTPGYLEGLEKAGFKVDRQDDLPRALLVRLGGHYMDVGSVRKITEGRIKVKADSKIAEFNEHGVVFENGDHLPADVVVLATGFEGDVREQCARLFGRDLADRLDDLWGLDAEGELRGAFKPCGHPAIWFSGGALGQTRFFSRFVALQIKAKLLGTPLPIYSRTPCPIVYR